MMTNELILTEEELKFISEKRVAEEQQKKEEEEEVEKEKKEKLEKLEREVEQFVSKQTEKNEATVEYLSQFEVAYPKAYILETTLKEKMFEAFWYNMETDTLELLRNKTIKFKSMQIVFAKDTSYIVDVKEHFVDKSGRWARRAHHESKGFKMSIRGMGWEQETKKYKKVSTVNKKIVEATESKKDQVEEKNTKILIKELLFETLHNIYGEMAKVIEKQAYVKGSNGGYMIDTVIIELKNGIKIQYRGNLNQEDKLSLYISNIDLASGIDPINVTDALLKI